jgi:hypothetical protein
MYLRLRGEKPFMSGNASRRSAASRSITFAPPARAILSLEDHSADAPVEQDHRRIRGEDDLQAFFLDALLDSAKGVRVVQRQTRLRRRGRKPGPFPLSTQGEPVLGVATLVLTSQTPPL